MRIWKTIPVLLLTVAAGCGETPTENKDAEKAPAVESPAPAAANSNPAPAPKPAPKPVEKAPAPAPAAASVVIPSGTKMSIILADPLSSGKNNAGDEFIGNLAAPVVVNGKTALEKGAKVAGKVVDAKGSGRVKGVASMSLELTNVWVKGKSVALSTETFATEAEAQKGKDATIVGGGAGIGTAIGALAGGKKGAATGAIIGGAAGAGTVLATKGKEVEFPSEAKLEFSLNKALTVTP
jgi:hypothetical protein